MPNKSIHGVSEETELETSDNNSEQTESATDHFTGWKLGEDLSSVPIKNLPINLPDVQNQEMKKVLRKIAKDLTLASITADRNFSNLYVRSNLKYQGHEPEFWNTVTLVSEATDRALLLVKRPKDKLNYIIVDIGDPLIVLAEFTTGASYEQLATWLRENCPFNTTFIYYALSKLPNKIYENATKRAVSQYAQSVNDWSKELRDDLGVNETEASEKEKTEE